MRIIYTKHAEDKLLRSDIKRLEISKNLIRSILLHPEAESKTKYGDLSSISKINEQHDLRIIYDIINGDIKVITFHVSAKGRYR